MTSGRIKIGPLGAQEPLIQRTGTNRSTHDTADDPREVEAAAAASAAATILSGISAIVERQVSAHFAGTLDHPAEGEASSSRAGKGAARIDAAVRSLLSGLDDDLAPQRDGSAVGAAGVELELAIGVCAREELAAACADADAAAPPGAEGSAVVRNGLLKQLERALREHAQADGAAGEAEEGRLVGAVTTSLTHLTHCEVARQLATKRVGPITAAFGALGLAPSWALRHAPAPLAVARHPTPGSGWASPRAWVPHGGGVEPLVLRDSTSAAPPPGAFAPTVVTPAVAHEQFLHAHTPRRAPTDSAPAAAAAVVGRGGSAHEGGRRGVMFRSAPAPGELSRGGSAHDGAPHVSGTSDPPFTTWPPSARSTAASNVHTGPAVNAHTAAAGAGAGPAAASIDARLAAAAATTTAAPPAAAAAEPPDASPSSSSPDASATASPPELPRPSGPRQLPSRARMVPGLTERSAAQSVGLARIAAEDRPHEHSESTRASGASPPPSPSHTPLPATHAIQCPSNFTRVHTHSGDLQAPPRALTTVHRARHTPRAAPPPTRMGSSAATGRRCVTHHAHEHAANAVSHRCIVRCRYTGACVGGAATRVGRGGGGGRRAPPAARLAVQGVNIHTISGSTSACAAACTLVFTPLCPRLVFTPPVRARCASCTPSVTSSASSACWWPTVCPAPPPPR